MKNCTLVACQPLKYHAIAPFFVLNCRIPGNGWFVDFASDILMTWFSEKLKRFNHHSKKFRNADGSFFSFFGTFFFWGGGNVFIGYELYTRCFFCRFVVVTWGKFSFLTYSYPTGLKAPNTYRKCSERDQHYVFFLGNYLQVFVYRCVHIALSRTIDVCTVHLLTFTM